MKQQVIIPSLNMPAYCMLVDSAVVLVKMNLPAAIVLSHKLLNQEIQYYTALEIHQIINN